MILKFPPQIGLWPTNKKVEFLNPVHCLPGHPQIHGGDFKADRSFDKLDTLQGFYSLSLVLLVPYVRALIPWVLQPPLVLAPPALSLNIKFNYCFPEQSLAPYILGTLFKASYSNVPHKKTHGHIEKEDFFELLLSVRLRS